MIRRRVFRGSKKPELTYVWYALPLHTGIAPGTLCLAGYMASKHALEAYSNALYGELAPWGIHVSLPLISRYG